MKSLHLFLGLCIISFFMSCANSNESPSEKEVDHNPGVMANDSVLEATKNPSDTGSENTITATHDHRK